MTTKSVLDDGKERVESNSSNKKWKGPPSSYLKKFNDEMLGKVFETKVDLFLKDL